MFDYTVFLPTLQTMAMVVCLGGSALLFLRSRSNRSRSLLAMIMLFWGLFYAVRVVGSLGEDPVLGCTRISVMNPTMLIMGNLYLIFLLLYPIEVVRPGWLNLKRTGLLLLPYATICFFYYIFLLLLGQEPVALGSMRMFLEHIGEFNVWYRLFMALSVMAYLVILFRLTWHYKKIYRYWCQNNYSNDENINVFWLRSYGVGVILIGIAYFVAVFNGTAFSFVVHNLIVQCFFSYTLYKGLFHDNPYTEGFFRHTLNEEEACLNAEFHEEQLFPGKKVNSEGSESAFLKNLSVYCDQVTNWMTTEKPYLNPNFKLMDVSGILPLNRTYISRVFNEGFGGSFSEVVRDYRVREAEWMLANCKDIPVGQVGELCGFSSPSVFHRAFVQSHDGLTPKRFRKQLGE